MAAHPQPRARSTYIPLAGVLVVLVVAKLATPMVPPVYDYDAYFYADVAQNVRDGLGLTTWMSLYHKGYTYFPHPSNIYPLWPLTLGYISRVLPMDAVGRWLPTLMYLVTLVLAFMLANRVFGRDLLGQRLRWLSPGLALAAILGTHLHFFVHTSMPYTEAMAMLALVITLWRGRAFFDAPTLIGGVEVGAWLAAALMIRSQLFIVTLAAVGTLGLRLVLSTQRRGLAVGAVGLAAGFLVGLAPWILYLKGFVPEVGLGTLLRFDSYRGSEALSALQIVVPTSGPVELLLDRLSGFAVAFNPAHHQSWFHSFSSLPAALLIALPVGLYDAARLGRQPGAVAKAIAWLRGPASGGALFLAIFALGGWLSLHAIHKATFTEWNFGSRHGLTAVFLFFACLVYLARHRWLALRGAAAVILLLTVGLSLKTAVTYQPVKPVSAARSKTRPQLAQWIQAQRDGADALTVAVAEPQPIASLTHEVGYHRIDQHTSLADLIALTDTLNTDYVILLPFMQRAVPGGGRAFRRAFREVAGPFHGARVYVRRGREGGP